MVSGTKQVGEAVALHVITEVDHDALHALQTRVIAVIDLAFTPEP